ncbi:MAG: RNase adapter RapZ [Thermodesulfobacteriota bacterium]
MDIIILSGLSGSGKSTAIKSLEDIGYFCVDNLHTLLIPKFIDLCLNSEIKLTKLALVIDIRIHDTATLDNFHDFIDSIKKKVKNIKILFLESKNEVLIKRYKETRRKHPLSQDGNILESVEKEREILENVRQISDYIIDTSEYNVHELREHINKIFIDADSDKISFNILSFGFKHGYPIDADIVLDARFLPNPFFDNSLKDLDGNNQKIKDFVLSSVESKEFIEKISDLLSFLIPKYKKEGKPYLNLAIGCTGGKHRSVVISNELASYFNDLEPSVKHRDINK